MKKKCFFFIFVFYFCLLQNGFCQDNIKFVTGTGVYCISDDITANNAKIKAITIAKINAIENGFGTIVQSEKKLQQISKFDKKSSKEEINEVYSNSILEDLNGEFIKQPEIICNKKTINDKTCYECEVKGEAISIKNNLSKEVTFYTLNKADKLASKNNFNDGETLYLYFKSSISGYLSVFLLSNKKAYKVLPYQNIALKEYESNMPIQKDKEYIFFDPNYNSLNFKEISNNLVDELILSVDEGEKNSTNTIAIVFSKNNFNKPLLEKTFNKKQQDIQPQYLSEVEFREWVIKQKISDPFFTYKESIITIDKK